MATRVSKPLHLLFFPHSPLGHLLPMLDMARLFARHGAEVSFVTVPDRAPLVQPTIDRDVASGHQIHLLLILPPSIPDPAPAEGHGSLESEILSTVAVANLLEHPFDQLLREVRPDAVITDMLFSWSAAIAHELGIPRLIFHGHCFFAQCIMTIIHTPGGLTEAAGDTVTLPGLPHRIEMLKTQIRDSRGPMPELADRVVKMMEAEGMTYGSVMNSFNELEPEYAEHYRKVMGKKAWAVGPVSLCNRDEKDKSCRGNKTSVHGDQCLEWLDSQKPRSVVYLCFGSNVNFSDAQLREISVGLESCGRPFIWVLKKSPGDRGGGDQLDWLPEGLQRKIAEGKGLIIRGWSPQLLILNHEAVGAYVVHCGWNSCLESITAGVPMVTWPLFADQFCNERLVVDVLKVGVPVGSKQLSLREEWTLVRAEEVRRAVDEIMGEGEEAEGRRRRAMELRELANRAVEEGGSSYKGVDELIRELLELRDA